MDNKKVKDNTTEIQQDQPPENWNRLSIIFRVFLPVAGLLIFFKQKQIFSRLLLQLDRNCVSVFCPSLSSREKLLKWAGSRLPETWSSQSSTLAGGVAELWSDGSLLCTLINSTIPGACPNPHRHWKKPPLHAQAIAYKYLGVIPIFTDSDLSGKLTVNLERSFLHYLDELQQAITKLSERNETPKSVSVHYIVRGMGLYSGEQHRKTVFYVYPNSNTAGHNSNIIVHIRGPYATYGKAVIPKFHNDLFPTPEISITSDLLATKTLLNGNVMKPSNAFINNFSLPFMQYHKKHMGDNIVIDVKMEDDRAKVTYIPKNYGMYEIIMVSNGELLRGCPFNVHILNNISGVEDSFDDEARVEDILNLRRRKILSKTIDFIDEQMSVADVLTMYKNKGKSTLENPINRDITKSRSKNAEIEIKGNEINDDKKSLDELVLPQQQYCNLIQPEKISEKNDSDEEMHSETTDSTNKSQLNFKDNANTQKNEAVLEKQNSESTSENHIAKLYKSEENNSIIDHNIINEDDPTQNVVHTVNNYSDNDNRCTHKVAFDDVSVGLQLKSTNESTNNYKKIGDVLDQKMQMFNTADNASYGKLISDSTPKMTRVTKIKIPEKFCERQNVANRKFDNGLRTKRFKNFINTSNKKEMPKNVSTELCENDHINKRTSYQHTSEYSPNKILQGFTNDINNNASDFHPNETKQYFVNRRNSKTNIDEILPKRFIKTEQHLTLELPLDRPINTSPICPNHIVPEVENEYPNMSVAEKRKIFAKKVPDTIYTSTNSSFSESENAEGSSNSGHFRQFEGLSVLNYLDSLKTSESTNKPNGYSLYNTMSLPNISSMQTSNFQNSVKERRNFWERMSTSSSSLSLNSDASLKRKPIKITETERCRLIWKKPAEAVTAGFNITTKEENSDIEKNAEISKSADNILSLTNFVPQDTKKYKSMDHSLDKCSRISIEERKKILLKQNYEGHSRTQPPRSLRNEAKKENRTKLINQNPPVKNKENEDTDTLVFSSISDRIRRFDSACNLSNDTTQQETLKKSDNEEFIKKKPTNVLSSNVLRNNSNRNLQDFYQPEILTVKSHFKRAIKYFKNLEEKSLNKSKANKKLSDFRRHSLDITDHRKGGSLNLPSISKRFYVSNVYEDVFGDRRGSFKGAVNRSALVEALATFSRRENRSFIDDEDKITYEMFQKRAKIKSRRSIKSIFDVYY